MIRNINFTAILLACSFFYLPGVVDTVHAAQDNTAEESQNVAGKISGKVTDIITAGGFTFAEIDTGSEKVWAACPGAATIKKGDVAGFTTEMPMVNFHSKALDRDFPVIYFIKQYITGNEASAATTGTPDNQAIKPQAAKPGEVSIGNHLREANLDGLNVENKNISDYRGKPLIINVWASWCGPCRAEMGSLTRLAQRYNGKEFNVIGISTDDYRNKAEGFIKQAGVTFDNFIDHNLLMENMLGAKFLPLTVLIDDQGRVIHKVDGAREWDSPEIIAAIGKAFRVKLTD